MSRILNRQRQLAEQGRLRLGFTAEAANGKTRPVRSETWVLTSHSEEHITAAAKLWGGEPERWQPQGNGVQQWRVITTSAAIDAILPPGEPLSQAYEQWSKGGCQVRCDGVTEQFTGNPCLCLARFGDQWYERDAKPKDICDSKSRLKVLLPEMPGLGVWRMETGSFYATDEIAGMVDVIRASVGDQILVPVRLRIEARTRVAGGQTKQFVVPVLELRGVNAGALLAGHIDAPQIGVGSPVTAQIEAGPTEDPYAQFHADLEKATTTDDCMAVWNAARDAGLVGTNSPATPGRTKLAEAISARGKELMTASPAEEPAEGEIVEDDDADALWDTIVRVAGQHGMGISDVEAEFAKANGGCSPATASAGELRVYLDGLKARAA